MDKIEIRLSGSGGQGIILAGVILADAALRAGYHAVQTQSYGPEARGGASRAEVIISKEPIDYPKVTQPDIFLALTRDAFVKYGEDVRPDGTIIADEAAAGMLSSITPQVYPILRTARDQGQEIVANMVALGVVAALLEDLPDKAYLENVISERVPAGTAELNLKAFQSGYAMIKSQE